MKQTTILKSGISVMLKMIMVMVMSLIVTLSLLMLLGKVPIIATSLSQLCCIMFFAAIPYTYVWEIGSTDKNKVNYGREDEDMLKGFKIGLIGAIPGILSALLMIFFRILGRGAFSQYVFVLINAQFLPTFLKVLPFGHTFVNFSLIRIFLCALLPMVLPLVTWVGYILGYRRISLVDKFIYKGAPRKRKMKRKKR